MDSFTPMMITIYLENGYCKLSNMPFDSILAKLYFQQEINNGTFDGNYYKQLPFLKMSDGIYHTSKPFYKISHIANETIIKSFNIDLYLELKGDMTHSAKILNPNTNNLRQHKVEFELIYTDKITYYVNGDYEYIDNQEIRKEIVTNQQLDAIISMPSGVFKPYAGVSTAVLVFVKGGKTDKVWFYDMQNDGYSLDDKRNKIEANDIPDILEQYTKKDSKNYKNTKKHFFVDIKDIKENDYDLSINRYKTIEYEEVIYAPTSEILGEIETLSIQINSDLIELKSLL